MYVVFLDIDGVLATARTHMALGAPSCVMWSRFDPVAVDFFNQIHDTMKDVRFVLSSTWRNIDVSPAGYMPHWAESTFRSAGFRGTFHDEWRTGEVNSLDSRGHEIKKWLDEHPETTDYLIFDDEYGTAFARCLPLKRHIKTDPHNGLTMDNIHKAQSIMGIWERR